jgi:hypothetical protein
MELKSHCGESAGKRSKVEDVALRRVGFRLDTDRMQAVVCRHLGAKPGEERHRRRGGWMRAGLASWVTVLSLIHVAVGAG